MKHTRPVLHPIASALLCAAALQSAFAAFDTQHVGAAVSSGGGGGGSMRAAKLSDGTPTFLNPSVSFDVKAAGHYTLHFRHAQPSNRVDDIQVRVAAHTGETIRFQFFGYQSNYPAKKLLPVDRASGLVWKKMDVNFEFPGEYRVSIGPAYGAVNPARLGDWGFRPPAPAVTDIWLSNDPQFNPERNPVATDAPVAAPSSPGFSPSAHVPPSTALNTTVGQRERLQLTLMECYPYYMDFIATLNLGGSMNYNDAGPDAHVKYDALNTGKPDFSAPGLEKRHPHPIGRAANSRGVYGKSFSYSFEPYREACYTNAVAWMKRFTSSPENDAVVNWFSAWEQCGDYDYGETSVNAFREYLAKRYGSLAALNAAWRQTYKSFDEIVPATWADCVGKDKLTNSLALARAKASFIDFRDFNSKAYASWLGLKTKAILENDPDRRDLSSAYSNNNLGSIMWLRWRPVSFEDSMQLTLKGSRTMGWDIYGSDDLVACSFEHWSSFGDDQIAPMIKEGSTHSPDPYMAVRSIWALFAEGMKGMSVFCMQESPKPELRKFGLMNPDDDMAPRPKLAAYSDAYRALHHVENLIAPAKRVHVGKPVALYYSQTCNLMQERGYGSIFDSAPDTLFRVFELIRANGYPCTVITDRQILETDRLDKISAIFFVDAQYIPTEVVDKVGKWVERGGHIVCDSNAGAYDGHGFPSDKMVKLLGIEPVVRARVDESAAENLAFGYSSQSYEVVNADELWQTQMEYLHQRDSQHPVAKMAGKVMFSGFGFQEVKSLDGEVIILHNNGGVGWNIRSIGKGSASYFAGYLGTLYGGGATQYEWRDAHADDSPYRFFDALLTYFGARKNAEIDLEQALNVRCGSPLLDAKGNMLAMITSYANHTLPDFRVRTFLPKGAKPPKQVFATRDATRAVSKLDFTYDPVRNAVEYTMPSFRVFGNAILVQDAEPIVSVDLGGVRRDAYGLADVRPGETIEAKVKVHNLSDAALAPGKVALRLPDGWFHDKAEVAVAKIPGRGESAEIAFKIKAPAVCASRRLKPINFIFESGKTTSTPAVEMVWFQESPQIQSRFAASRPAK